ncbi:preprotein translocase subunit SecA [Candidatus Bodocaedibacter vickermanii]|uniref:Protein translocase subunit SecA n=1 Tax=Candidatus Bodocaedibacter vickermanii TaxID=2741701 RepID=A0A7L9RRY0_9PROT|nr:Protein translocase subunit SecA [Candidatus Paracaedibacteraceae bacterium 'Lake Konstanz']
MLLKLVQKIFGSANDRLVRRLGHVVQKINEIESNFTALSDYDLQQKTAEFKVRLEKGETLDDILPEAFATVREAARRVLGERHYDVQLIGGMVLHNGMISEMRTGEGKTLVATAPVYLNALSGKGVHVVTVNDYLAQRDAEWMGRVYNFLGLTVGCIISGISDMERKKAYQADITYATNNELGFDYLRDNMKFSLNDMVQRPFNYAIVDEVDSILVDEARTPLIISGPAEDSSQWYYIANRYMSSLTTGDYEKDEKGKSITLTDSGSAKIEEALERDGYLKGSSLYDLQNISIVHHINQALKAHNMFHRDVDYIVRDGQVLIVDEFTGRIMDGRRYSEGLHQALEAKENVNVEVENQTLASITYQNYFRLYPKLSGMAGTAMTEAQEFDDIYKLVVVEIPTNQTVTRKDNDDEIYRTKREKLAAIVQLVKERHEKQQPILVGTISIENSEEVARELTKAGLKHNVLNARFHDKEAEIIAEAGYPGAITVATNMAGRGTDIKLGGSYDVHLKAALQKAGAVLSETARKELEASVRAEIKALEDTVKAAGGLYVIGTERHESRRIDNQLRGRSGRQGDPGETKFFLSLEDDLMRIFGSERLDAMLVRLGLKEGESITHPWVNKALERAQKKVEARNYDIRKHLLKYDDVMNDQRKVIYEQRKEVMNAESIHETMEESRLELIHHTLNAHISESNHIEQWDLNGLHEELLRIFNVNLPLDAWAHEEGVAYKEFVNRVETQTIAAWVEKEKNFPGELLHRVEKDIFLHSMDQLWKDHLHTLDYLRTGINLRAYAQRNPLNEYKQEAFDLFTTMLDKVKETIVSILSHMNLNSKDEDAQKVPLKNTVLEDANNNRLMTDDELELMRMVPRNGPCPCGSGKRYKECHGKLVV